MTANSIPLPPELALHIDPGAQQLPGGNETTVLLGGSPLRLLRLDARANNVFQQLAKGIAIGEVTGASSPAVSRLARRLLDGGLAHPRWPRPSNTADDAGQTGEGGGCDPSHDVTVVIPVKDRATELRRLLPTIGVAPQQIIVVDDGSSDNTAELARQFGATVICTTTSTGPAAARNRGLARVTTPFVAFIDSDCTATPGWLATLAEHLCDPAVALVAPRIAAPAAHTITTETTALGRYLQVRSPLDLGPNEAAVRARTRVAYLPAAALLGRTAVLQALGGFAEELRVGEDVDLVWRMVDAGHTVRYEPRATVIHHDPLRLGAVLRRNCSYGTSAAPLTSRHPGKVTPLAVSGWSALAWAGIATQTVVGVVGGMATACVTAALLPRKLSMLATPVPTGLKLALRGHLSAGRLIASATTRTWLPFATSAAVVSRRARRALLAAVVVPALLEWHDHRRNGSQPPNPAAYLGLRTLDDAAYCAGVWRGVLKERNAAALRPDLTSWPGRPDASKLPV
jgi:mycofactocin glycosyltransferase